MDTEDLRHYYEGLIAFRKHLPGLCDKSANACQRISGAWAKPGVVGCFVDNRSTLSGRASGMVSGTGSGRASGAAASMDAITPWETLYVIYNRTNEPVETELPKGSWQVLLDGESSFLWKKKQ